MSDEAFYSPNRKPPPWPRPTSGEHVWTLRNRVASAKLRTHAEAAVELQLLMDGELFLGQRYPTRARALEKAEFCRLHLEAEAEG